MENKMTFMNKNGENITVSVIATFKNELGEKFIAYTDSISTETLKSDLLVSKYIDKDEVLILEEIQTEEEWNFANRYLEDEVFSEVVYDD